MENKIHKYIKNNKKLLIERYYLTFLFLNLFFNYQRKKNIDYKRNHHDIHQSCWNVYCGGTIKLNSLINLLMSKYLRFQKIVKRKYL